MSRRKPSPAATAAALALNEARTRKLSPARRKAIAKAAIKARWDKRDAERAQNQALTDARNTTKKA